MSRHLPKSRDGSEHKPKRSRKITEDADKMPTIPDDLQAAAGTEESESEREGGPKKLFSVGQLETEEETEDDNHHRYTCQDHYLDFTEIFAFLSLSILL